MASAKKRKNREFSDDDELDEWQRPTKEKKRQYGGDDDVDKWLMNRVANCVNHDQLGSLARHLEVEKSVFSSITAPTENTFEVSNQKMSGYAQKAWLTGDILMILLHCIQNFTQ